jgi:hypothetical protein
MIQTAEQGLFHLKRLDNNKHCSPGASALRTYKVHGDFVVDAMCERGKHTSCSLRGGRCCIWTYSPSQQGSFMAGAEHHPKKQPAMSVIASGDLLHKAVSMEDREDFTAE